MIADMLPKVTRSCVRCGVIEGKIDMAKVVRLLQDVRRDENGAALVEYTVLLGILVVAVIASIIVVGTWVSGKWSALSSALPT